MALKIEIKDIPELASTDGSSKVLVCYNEEAKLLPESWLVSSSQASTTFLCEDDGETYLGKVRLVDGEPVWQLVQI